MMSTPEKRRQVEEARAEKDLHEYREAIVAALLHEEMTRSKPSTVSPESQLAYFTQAAALIAEHGLDGLRTNTRFASNIARVDAHLATRRPSPGEPGGSTTSAADWLYWPGLTLMHAVNAQQRSRLRESAESPIEQRLAECLRETLPIAAPVAGQVSAPTILGAFRLDLVIYDLQQQVRIVVECDGKAHHDPERDAWRDTAILATEKYAYLYPFRGTDLIFRMEEVLGLLHERHTGLRRGLLNYYAPNVQDRIHERLDLEHITLRPHLPADQEPEGTPTEEQHLHQPVLVTIREHQDLTAPTQPKLALRIAFLTAWHEALRRRPTLREAQSAWEQATHPLSDQCGYEEALETLTFQAAKGQQLLD